MKNNRASLLGFILFTALCSPATSQIASEDVYKIGDGVSAPKLIHKVEPEYTKRAKKAKLHGTVMLGAVVSSQGLPEDIKVSEKSGPRPGCGGNKSSFELAVPTG